METNTNAIAADLGIDIDFGDNAYNLALAVHAIADTTGIAFRRTNGRCVTITEAKANKLGGVALIGSETQTGFRVFTHAANITTTAYSAGVDVRPKIISTLLADARERGAC